MKAGTEKILLSLQKGVRFGLIMATTYDFKVEMSSWDNFKSDLPQEHCLLGEVYHLEKDAGYPSRRTSSMSGDRSDKAKTLPMSQEF